MKTLNLNLVLAVCFGLQLSINLKLLAQPAIGLVAHYPLEGNAVDTSGNGNTGVPVGNPLEVDGVVGHGLFFDGTDDRISLPGTFLGAGLSQGTIACWVRVDSFDPIYGRTIFNRGIAAAHTALILGVDGDGKLAAAIDDQTPPRSLGTLPLGRFAHAAVTWNGSRLKYYINGLPSGDFSFAGTPQAGGSMTVDIGRDDQNVGFFHGVLDDILIYNRALSAAEIQQLATASNEGLVAHYKFDGNASDASGGGHHGTPLGDPGFTSDRFGQPNKALRLDGIDDCIWIGDGLRSSHISACLWFRTLQPNPPTSPPQWIIRDRACGWGLIMGSPPGYQVFVGDIAVYPFAAAECQPETFMPASPVQNYNDGRWHFAAITYDGSDLRLYVDGVAKGSKNFSPAGGIQYSPGGLAIGRDGDNPTGYFQGDVDDVRIYNRALSAAEVQQLANEGGQPKRPVVVIHGVMGSALTHGPPPLGFVRGFPADVTILGDARNLQCDSTGVPLNNGISDQLEAYPMPPELEIGALHIKDIYRLDLLVNSLQDEGYPVQKFVYDWRLSVRSNAQAFANYVATNAALSGTKFDIVAHSMGGLIAKQFVEDLGPTASSKVETAVLLGCPNLGAPKIFKVLRFGDPIVPVFDALSVKRASHNFPSAFNLIPGELYIDTYPKFFEDRRDDADENGFLDFAQFKSFVRNAKEVVARLLAVDPSPTDKLSGDLASIEYENYQDSRDRLMRTTAGVNLFLIAGYGKDTIWGLKEYEGEYKGGGSPITGSTTAQFGRLVEPATDSGDGTVPLLSAAGTVGKVYYADFKAMELDHTSMLGHTEIHKQVTGLLEKGAGIYGDERFFNESAPTRGLRRLIAKLRSPAHVVAVSSRGQRTGVLSDGMQVDEIPGALAEQFGHQEFVIVPEDGPYRFEIIGNGSGTFSFDLQEIDEQGRAVRTFQWIGIPVARGAESVTTMLIGSNPTPLLVDTDFDGTPDTPTPPTEAFDGDGGRHELGVAMTSSHAVTLVGKPVEYSLTVSNAGPDFANAAKLFIQLPGGVAVVSSSSQFTQTGNVIQFNLGTIGMGASASVMFTVVSSMSGFQTNQAGCSANGVDIRIANNFVSTETLVVAKPCGLVERLIDHVNGADVEEKDRRPLIATLQAACAAFDRTTWIAAVNQLQAFQNKVRAQISPIDPTVADFLIRGAQEIINIATGENLKPHARRENGKTKFEFVGVSAQRYVVQASTTLMEWTTLGAATDAGDGQFTFEDATNLPYRFYRINYEQ